MNLESALFMGTCDEHYFKLKNSPRPKGLPKSSYLPYSSLPPPTHIISRNSGTDWLKNSMQYGLPCIVASTLVGIYQGEDLESDISKVFDSVDLNMLRFALQRLRLPNNAIQFLLSLFMACSNCVITAHGPTPPYRVRIVLKNEKKDPYRLISPSVPATLSPISDSPDVLHVNNLVFMDNSTLISSSKKGMEHMLSITEEFYRINNTSANHNKYVLATNAVSTTQDLSPVNFNLLMSQLNYTSIIAVTPIPMSSSFRFLEVWFNITADCKIKQLKQECNSFSAILWPAKLTVQHVVYLYNTVLIPKLEYRMQVTHLSEAECFSATSSTRTLVKHKAKLSRSTPNAILYLSQALGLINLFAHQQ
ncbi:unnamed protein product [Rhizophagus irregularis]|nr:unnamed protein product [Rhizophagus irregularis]